MLQRVLIVDDSDADLLYTRIMVERSGAAREVVTVESAREALALLSDPAAMPVDLVLLDINMPGMDGFQFLKAYEALGASKGRGPVVVMLTSSPDPADRERALAHSAVNGYVVKPLDKASALSLVDLAGPP